MVIQIKRGIITDVRAKADGSAVYFKVRTADSVFAFSTKTATYEQVSKVALVPVQIDGSLSGGEWKGNQFLRAENITIKPL